MPTLDERRIDERLSGRQVKIGDEEMIALRAAADVPDAKGSYADLAKPEVRFPEPELRRMVIDEVFGKTVRVGKTPEERDIHKRIADEVEGLKDQGVIVETNVDTEP